MSKIYRHPTQPTVDLPALDLLTFLFGTYEINSKHSSSHLETVPNSQNSQTRPTPSPKKTPSSTSTRRTPTTPSPNPRPETFPSALPMASATRSALAPKARTKTS